MSIVVGSIHPELLSNHFVLSPPLGLLSSPCSVSEWIYAHPKRLMEPIGLQAALRDPDQTDGSLDEQVGDWNTCLSKAINDITPWCPLHHHVRPAPQYTVELCKMKWELRWLEWVWQHCHDEISRTPYWHFMKAYEVVVKPAKKEFYATSIASASLCSAQLFRVI